MPFSADRTLRDCPICKSHANLHLLTGTLGAAVDCTRCGDFQLEYSSSGEDWLARRPDNRERSLASLHIRRMQADGRRPKVDSELFEIIKKNSLPSPIDAQDNFLIYLASKLKDKIGSGFVFHLSFFYLLSEIGVVDCDDIIWIVDDLSRAGLLRLKSESLESRTVFLTGDGWRRIDDLRKARVASRFAFFCPPLQQWRLG